MKLESPARKDLSFNRNFDFAMTEWLKIFIKSRGCGEGRAVKLSNMQGRF